MTLDTLPGDSQPVAGRPINDPSPRGLSHQQRARLRALLVQRWRDEVARIIDVSLQLHGDPGSTDGAAADPGAPLVRRDLATRHTIRLLAQAHRALADTEAALEGVQRAEFGHCEVCAAEIPFERLEADPVVALCSRCEQPSGPRGSRSARPSEILRPSANAGPETGLP